MSSLQLRTFSSHAIQFAKSNFTLAVEFWAPSGSQCSRKGYKLWNWVKWNLGPRAPGAVTVMRTQMMALSLHSRQSSKAAVREEIPWNRAHARQLLRSVFVF